MNQFHTDKYSSNGFILISDYFYSTLYRQSSRQIILKRLSFLKLNSGFDNIEQPINKCFYFLQVLMNRLCCYEKGEYFYTYTFISYVHDVVLLIILQQQSVEYNMTKTAATSLHSFALFVDNMIIYCPLGLDGETLSLFSLFSVLRCPNFL